MILTTAQYASGQTGFSRMFKLNKYGNNNTVGQAHHTTINHIFRLQFMGAGHVTAESCILHVKNFSYSGNQYVVFTTDKPLMKNLEVYIEETDIHYILIVKHQLSTSTVQLELISDDSSDYLDVITNDPYTYVPTGKLIKAQLYDVMYSNSTGTNTNQWAKLATIKINTATTNYTGLVNMFEASAIQTTSSIRTFSIQIRQQNLNEAPRVNVMETSSPTENRFEVYTKSTFTATETTIELWVKLLGQFTQVGYQLISEYFSDGSFNVSTQWHVTPALTGTQPTGTLVQAKGGGRRISLSSYFQNSWVATSGYDNTVSLNGNQVTVRFGVTGGTMTSGTDIATIDTSLAPKGTMHQVCMLEDSGGVRTPVFIAMYSSGKIQIRGTLSNNNLLSGGFQYTI